MKNFITKRKINHEGNSQFTREKLDSEYNPKYRTAKHQLMSFQKISPLDRHEFKSKEQNQICDRALQQIKKGSNLIIDWNTKANFRATNSLFPKLRTEPNQIQNGTFQQNSQLSTPIQQKRLQLAKLLHVRHKKHYMKTKRQQEEQQMLFGQPKPVKSLAQLTQRRAGNKLFRKLKFEDDSLEKVQTSIIKQSKLQILKDQLKEKFTQIRNYIAHSHSKKKQFFD